MTGSIALALAAGYAFLIAGVAGCGSGLVTHTLENNRKIDASFQQAAHFVETFRERESRLPDQAEFDRWASSTPSRPYTPKGMEIVTEHYPEEAVAEFGEPEEGSYLLMIWRGEWMEYYAGWSGRSTITHERSDYYVLGSALWDVLVFTLLGVAGIYGTRALWPRLP